MTKNTIRVGDDVVVEGFAAKAGTLRVGTASLFVKNAGVTVTILPDAWHHSYAEHYDSTKQVLMTGKFVSIDWVNPHPIAHFTADTPDGRSQEWLAELPPL
jgi:putative NADPH-quinone reductase